MPKPFIHITDLYHPPQDPDDHFDAATLLALPGIDLRAVILDITREFLEPAPAGRDIARDPGYVPVLQLSFLTGRSIPVAAGPPDPLRSLDDSCLDRPRRDQAGIVLFLEALRTSPAPVTVSVVGSARVIAAAFNRDPLLVRSKTSVILLNAGSLDPSREEWNVMLDRAAYIRVWRSGLPIHWYPCTTDQGPFCPDHPHGTYWQATHATLLDDLPPLLRRWFSYALTGSSRGDIIRALSEGGDGAVWENLLSEPRNMWSTASLVMAAGYSLVRRQGGWRFLPGDQAPGAEVWPWELLPVSATVDDDGSMRWKAGSGSGTHRLFRRRPGTAFGPAMAEALNALFRTLLPDPRRSGSP